MKEANKVIRREDKYKNLSQEDAKKILTDTEDWIFQRDPSDRYDYKKNRPFRDDPDFDPDDPDYIQRMKDEDAPDFAEGGRAGYKMGLGPGFKKLLQSMSDNSPVQAYKKYLESVKNRAKTDPKQLAPELGAVAAGGIFVNRRMSDILEGMNEKQKEKYLEEFKKEIRQRSVL